MQWSVFERQGRDRMQTEQWAVVQLIPLFMSSLGAVRDLEACNRSSLCFNVNVAGFVKTLNKELNAFGFWVNKENHKRGWKSTLSIALKNKLLETFWVESDFG